MHTALQICLTQALGHPVKIASTCNIGGGCINQAQVLILDDGSRVFVKFNGNPPPRMFATEARGLALLAEATEGPRVPKVITCEEAASPQFLILEYLESTSPSANYHVHFGRALAALHRTTAATFGLDHSNFIGSTPQINTQEADGLVFFRDHRLGYQQERARQSGLLPVKTDHKIDQLRDNLGELLDLEGEQPALSHGDLWSGNHFCGPGGAPVIFDPAAHYGLREADLAMTELFGRLPQAFYDAYHQAFPLNPGYAERRDLFNLYHLLNHLNLFGGSYLGSVESIVHRFTR